MRFFGGTVEAETLDDAKGILRRRIGANLTHLRKMRGLERADVAQEIGNITSDTLRNYELGTTGMSYENAWRLADFYSVTIGALAGRIAYEPAESAFANAQAAPLLKPGA